MYFRALGELNRGVCKVNKMRQKEAFLMLREIRNGGMIAVQTTCQVIRPVPGPGILQVQSR